MKQSGLQKEVLGLYRKILRQAIQKDRAGSCLKPIPILLSHKYDAPTTFSYAVSEFRKQAASVKRSDFKKIEYMMRKGEKQLKLLQMPGVTVVSGT
jgi:hypothetical protein